MSKLNICDNVMTIVCYQDFIAFSLGSPLKTWTFQKVVKCSENCPKSNDGSIECSAFSPCGKYFGVCFDKNIIIYTTVDWNVLYFSAGERKASSLKFFSKSKVVLLADKSGTASFYSFSENKLEKMNLCLGHNSMLTSALVTHDEKYVLTCDRDEKIRVTNYPNVYNIERFCLGHKLFVSSIEFLPTDKRVLISGSGDGTIKFWDFISGKELNSYDLNSLNEPNANPKTVITKIVLCEQDCMSLMAVSEYKSNQIRILRIKGNLNEGLNIELVGLLKLKSIPWDLAFWNETLVCLMPNEKNQLAFWSTSDDNVTETEKSFKAVTQYLTDNWDSFISMSQKIFDDVPTLFKREVDNLQEYEKRKKARLLKTGKTS